MAAAGDLITYHDAIVPWVARWTGERAEQTANIGFEQLFPPDATPFIRVRYTDEQTSDRPFDDEVLIFREGMRRGGKPEFGQVHARRQMNCMRTPRCQVCGRSLKNEPGGVPWLFSKHQLAHLEEHWNLTENPPTCLDCVPVARQLCPHVREHGSQILLVQRYQPFGYDGDWYDLTDPQNPVRVTKIVPFSDPDRHLLIAKQFVVHLTEFKEID